MVNKALSKEDIKAKFHELFNEKKITPQKRGFEFENLIYSVLNNEGLEPRAGFRPDGEQVDGSFFWNNQTFLFEAKWVSYPLPVSSIYAFKGKLDGKFHTTSGIYISVNGYSEGVEDALKLGKSLNILLFDENDIPLIFNGDVEFSEILKFKLRQAGDTGSLQVPFDLKHKAKEISSHEYSREKINDEHKEIESNKTIFNDDLLLFVENKSDESIAKNFIEPINQEYSLSYHIEPLDGIEKVRQIPSLVNIYREHSKTKAVIVILDDDLITTYKAETIQNIEKQLQNSSIFVKTKFLFISEQLKIKLGNKLTLGELRKEREFERLEMFISEIIKDYYDPEVDIPQQALNGAVNNLRWNYEEGIIEVDDEVYNFTHVIKSMQELIEYLNEEVVKAINAEMPLEWLNEQSFLDYSEEAIAFISNNCEEQIIRLGWNIDDI